MIRNKIFQIALSFMAILSSVPALAQADASWLENTMYQSGKINVVITVVALVFIVIVIYLISLDRRLKKMEANEKNNER